MADKRRVFRTYKDILQLNMKKTKKPQQNMGKRFERHCKK